MADPRGPGGLPLAEYRDHRGVVAPEQVLWENNGWSLRGRVGDREVLLWTSPYFLTGPPGGAFRLHQASVAQTMLVTADDPERPLQESNDFLAVGWEPDELEPWSVWSVRRDPDGQRWATRGREVLTAPDHWRITGDHAGLDLDVRLDPSGDAMWLSPPEEGWDRREDRWFVAEAAATGTLDLDGAPRQLTAHGLHERHVHLGTTYNPVRLLRGRGVTWHSGSTDGLSYSLLARPDMGRSWALVTVDGRTWRVRDADRVTVEVTSEWVDPETGLHLPRAWRMGIAADGLQLELETSAHARAYYLWNFLRDGVTVLYWWLCTSRGAVTTSRGRRPLDAVRSEVHLNKTIYEARRRRAD